ncbi:hypothetical protein [Burkholderia diffusa]|uniref:hypothetical protein n=1 Tax=Burkholderia diffusa TaxID=488732 RepID=UPI0012D977B5|nr:hypothetical protein [Burkholderia diffusa]
MTNFFGTPESNTAQPLVPSRRHADCVSPLPRLALENARQDAGSRHRRARRVAGFVTMWAGYDNGKPPARHYDGSRRRLALAAFAAADRAARLIHRLIWNIDHEL